MKREELVRSREYWVAQLQIKLYETLKEYLRANNLTQSQFADEMGVNKSYVSQVLNGAFDHKISKYIDLMMACNKVPVINTMSIDEYIDEDSRQLKPVLHPHKENNKTKIRKVANTTGKKKIIRIDLAAQTSTKQLNRKGR